MKKRYLFGLLFILYSSNLYALDAQVENIPSVNCNYKCNKEPKRSSIIGILGSSNPQSRGRREKPIKDPVVLSPAALRWMGLLSFLVNY